MDAKLMRQPDASPENIDITTLFRAIKRKTGVVLVLSLVAGALTYTALSLIAPQFVSQSDLSIRAKGTANPFASPRGGFESSQIIATQIDAQAVNTHVRALQSPDLAIEIAKKLRLERRPEFNSALGPYDAMGRLLDAIGFGSHDPNESERDRVINAYFDRLVVYSPTESRIITIRFASIDPDLAAKIANLLATEYRQRLARATVVETDAVRKALEPKISQLTQEVLTAEEDIARFRSRTGLLRGGAQQTPLNQQQLGDLTTELTRASAARSSLQASATTARELIRRGSPEIIPQVQRSTLIQNLIQQRVQVERDLRKYSATMKPAHPVIRQLNADLRSIKRQISHEVANVVAAIDKEAHVAVEREASIKRSIEQIKNKVADTSGDQVELSRLEGVAKAKRAELERLQAQFESNRARAESGAVPVEAEIMSVAQPASIAEFPKKAPYTLLVAAGTFLFGMAWAVTSAILSGARPQPARREEHAVDAPLVDEISKVARSNPKPMPSLQAAPVATKRAVSDGPVRTARNVSEIADGLVSIAQDTNGPCRSLIATANPRVSAQQFIEELGQALASRGANTIVVDWSTRGMSQLLGGNNKDAIPGMMDLLTGKAKFADVVRALPGGTTHTITCGAALNGKPGPSSEHLNIILDALDGAYDQIILLSGSVEGMELFEKLDGRVDAGLVLDCANESARAIPDGTFLGFTVADMLLLRYSVAPSARTRTAGQVKAHIASARSTMRESAPTTQ